MDHLALALSVAKEAGAVLREEFHRGPRGAGDHADVDIEVEQVIRAKLLASCPGYGYLGEETGSQAGNGSVWVVDPNDGTRDFLKGRRGSAVSIALVRDGVPVLGVVYSPMSPDDDGDLLAWEKGGPSVRRVESPPVVLVAPGADRRASVYLERIAPYRMRPMTSVAYRLALCAAGEGVAAIGLRGPRDWDYAAGHALLLGAGRELLDRNGTAIRYSRDGESLGRNICGGSEEVVRGLVTRDWEGLTTTPHDDLPFVQPILGRAHRNAARLRRAHGCLLGQAVGDALGSVGSWGTIEGQPTDDTELAITLARSIVAQGEYRAAAASAAYAAWWASSPFDIGSTIRSALRLGRPDEASQANGSLMRISPLGILGWNRDATDLARTDSALTHPNPVCGDACAAFVAAISHGIANGDRRGAYEAARAASRGTVREVLDRASSSPPQDYLTKAGWVLVALQNAFFRLLHAESFEAGLVDTVACGGDTDTNAAIAGVLLGAVFGREAIPFQWRQMVLTSRPLAGQPGVNRPRPREYWPVDLLELAERLMEP